MKVYTAIIEGNDDRLTRQFVTVTAENECQACELAGEEGFDRYGFESVNVLGLKCGGEVIFNLEKNLEFTTLMYAKAKDRQARSIIHHVLVVSEFGLTSNLSEIENACSWAMRNLKEAGASNMSEREFVNLAIKHGRTLAA